MKNGWAIVGGGLFLLLTLRQAAMYGREWDFGGDYGLPVIVLAADGRHYRDGSEIDDITLAIARSGHEEGLELLLMGVIVSAVAYVVWSRVRIRRAWKRHCLLKALLDAAEECQRAGRWEGAEEAFRRFEMLWAADKRNPPLRRTPP